MMRAQEAFNLAREDEGLQGEGGKGRALPCAAFSMWAFLVVL